MTCVTLRPDPQTLFNQIQSMFSSTVLGGGKVIPESNEWYVVANDYAMAENFYAVADQMWREANPETACCENLYKMAAQNGVYPKPAGYAEGYAKLTGVAGASIPPNLEIQTDIGTFTSVDTIPLTMPDTGSIVIRIRALVPGPTMNASGEVATGTLTTPAPGIDTAVQICGGRFCGGAEAETCDIFRRRYLDRLAYHPKATMEWIKQKLLEWPCASRVCVREGACCRCDPECEPGFGCKNCGNNMEFYVLFDDVFPCGIAPQYVIDDINKWLFGEHQGYGEGQVEIGVCGKLYTPTPLMVNAIIDIEGCPSTAQKQLITDQIRALFRRICPSLPLRAKQLELIVATIIGAEINSSVRFEIPGYETAVPPYPRELVYADACGLEPECDVLPCINEIKFTGPDQIKPPC